MNINEVGQQLANVLNKSSNLFISSGDDFSRELTLGQIIKGKVLRSYDNGRYQVDFGGQKKTVDSAVPLKTGELIQGRVVNVGDQIEIKRLPVTNEQGAQANNLNARNESSVLGLTSKWDSFLIQGMRDYKVRFNTLQRADIVKVMKQVDKPQKVILSAAAMLKQNIGISQELLLMLDRLQNKQQSLSLFDVEQLVPKLVTENNTDETGALQTKVLVNHESAAIAISQMVIDQETKARFDDVDQDNITEFFDEHNKLSNTKQENVLTDDRKNFKNLWYLVNSQVDGSTQHRVATLPMWVNERLIEVDVVMYEQHENSRAFSSIDNKKIVFSLELEKLGNVTVEILLNNRHVKMSISTDSSLSTEALLGHGIELTESIKEHNLLLDEMSYQTREKDEIGNIISSVLEHYVAQDSLSRLM